MTVQAKFLSGSTMRHVVTMTLTSAIGLTFMFLIDAATLFWVSRLGEPKLMAALGFAWAIQFFIISSGLGFAIATTAMVSRALGAGGRSQARRYASGAMAITLATQIVLAMIVFVWRREALVLAGAQGETLDLATHFLAITLPALPFMALGMTGGGTLRAIGDAWRAMAVTLAAGCIAAALDPLFIFGFGLGLDGAAWVMAIARCSVTVLSIWFLVRVHDMLGRISLREIRKMLHPFFLVAGPAALTQLSTPFGNALLTALMASHGDEALAGLAVVTRLTVLAFGGIFALSGAIGGIFGQNYGAGQMDRVRSTYRDALVFNFVYTLAAWALLWFGRDAIADVFKLHGEARAILDAFAAVGAGGFVFGGALFVANAAFNTLGRPLWSTGFNWLRDGLALWPLAAAGAWVWGGPGVIFGQAAAGVLVGAAAAWRGRRFVAGLRDRRPGLEKRAEPLHPAPTPST